MDSMSYPARRQRAHTRLVAILAHLNNTRDVMAEKPPHIYVDQFETAGDVYRAKLNLVLTNDELNHLGFCFHIIRQDEVSHELVYCE